MKPYSILVLNCYYPDTEELSIAARDSNESSLNSGESQIMIFFPSIPEMMEVYCWFRKNNYRVSIGSFCKNPNFGFLQKVTFDHEISVYDEEFKRKMGPCLDLTINVTVLKRKWKEFWKYIDRLCNELNYRAIHDKGTNLKNNLYIKY